MPPKPTCKVVKIEGQRGARIDPKGCKVRTTKDAQGNKRQYNKQGQEKFKITEIRNEHAVTIAGSRQYATVVRHWKTTTGPNAMSVAQKGAFKRNHKMIYDTGATMTTMSRSTLRKIGENPNRKPAPQPLLTVDLPNAMDLWICEVLRCFRGSKV